MQSLPRLSRSIFRAPVIQFSRLSLSNNRLFSTANSSQDLFHLRKPDPFKNAADTDIPVFLTSPRDENPFSYKKKKFDLPQKFTRPVYTKMNKDGSKEDTFIAAEQYMTKSAANYTSPDYARDINLPVPVPEKFSAGRKGQKVKFALMLSYRGTGYKGLQFNRDAKTIERDISEAIFKAGFIDESNHGDLGKVKWTRAARTDKGVHAAANFIGLKMRVLPELIYPEVAAARKLFGPYAASRHDEIISKLTAIGVDADVATAGVTVELWGETVFTPSFTALLAEKNIDWTVLENQLSKYVISQRETELLKMGEGGLSDDADEDAPASTDASGEADKVPHDNYTDYRHMDKQERKVLMQGVLQKRQDNFKSGNKVKQEERPRFFDANELSCMFNPHMASDNICARINYFLPDQIRCVRAIKVVGSFDSKVSASSRTYEYIIPSFAFIPTKDYPAGVFEAMVKNVPPLSELQQTAETAFKANAALKAMEKGGTEEDDVEQGKKRNRKSKDTDGDITVELDKAEEDQEEETNHNVYTTTIDDVPQAFLDYRMTPSVRAKVDSVLSTFKGTKNHHNFTKGRTPKDPSCSRHILSFVSTGFFYKDGVEFMHMVVHGQSFMLHQIRKMVGYTIAVCRDTISQDMEAEFFSRNRYRLPIAPALGLLLDHVHYDLYDKKAVELTRRALSCKKYCDARDTILCNYESALPLIKQFKEQQIYPEICGQELATQSCWTWLHWVNDTNYWGKPQTTDFGDVAPQSDTKVFIDHGGKRAKPATSILDLGAGQQSDFAYVSLVDKTTAALPTYSAKKVEADTETTAAEDKQ